MHYSSNCGCGCNYDCGCNTVSSTCCTTTNNIVTTTTVPCIGEKCDELYSADCVVYKGTNIPCYGLNINDTLTDLLDSIILNFTDCITTNVCFKIKHSDGTIIESCSGVIGINSWNGKQYYKIKIHNCSDLIGYVYWNSTDNQWEFSSELGGTPKISVLSILSASPISSIPWNNSSNSLSILSSTSGFCPPTTTTSTSTSTSTTTSTTTTSTTTSTTSTTTTSTTTTRPPTTTSTTSTTSTTTTTTFIPIGFTANFGSCYLDTGTGSVIITNCIGGTGVYQRSTTTFDNLSDALNNTSFVDISNPTTGYTYPFEPSGTRYIVVRDKNNTVNKLIKTTTGYCCWRNVKVYTNGAATFEYIRCDGVKELETSTSSSAYLLSCSVKQSVKFISGTGTIDLSAVLPCP
jgi:hypothetical protein